MRVYRGQEWVKKDGLCTGDAEAGDRPLGRGRWAAGTVSSRRHGMRSTRDPHRKNMSARTIQYMGPRYNRYVQHIKLNLQTRQQKMRETERGELMKYFCDHLNAARMRDGHMVISMPRMGKILEGIPTKDLYYLKRVCSDAGNFSKKFWFELNPEKYEHKMRDFIKKQRT